MSALDILIVDDEALALDRLARICQRLDGVCVVGLAASGAEALDQAAARAPDVVLLDITMPDMDGLETARRLRALADPPAIIFTTAHEEFAIDAFAIEAVHYLLKPVLRGQLEEALLRVRQHRTKAAEPARSLGEIWVSRGYELIRLELASVDHIEAEGDYMRFHAAGQSYLHYVTIKRLEAELDPAHFLRVHRSYIVAVIGSEAWRAQAGRLGPDPHRRTAHPGQFDLSRCRPPARHPLQLIRGSIMKVAAFLILLTGTAQAAESRKAKAA